MLAVPFEKPFTSRPRISLLAAWVVFCVFCNFIGWVLSGLNRLNAAGYAVAFGLGLLVFGVWKTKTNAVFFQLQDFRKLQRRFRRSFPMAFLILATVAILGGVLHPPSNYDALAYRLPRVLHWLAEGRWHWIHTDFNRVNVRGAGIEWISAPVILFAGTDRPLFLLSAISFLLLPGLIFSIFTRLGVPARVARYWMWPLSCGYCFLLQAGSVGNDLVVVPFVLAAIDYALRSHQRRSPGALWMSILSVGMFTGIKANTLPLLLPYVIALAPGWRLWLKKLHITVAVSLVALVISFVPIAFFNLKHLGDWTGEVSQHMSNNASLSKRLAGNVVILTINGLTPPIAPFAGWWNSHVAKRLAATSFGKGIDANFETGVTIFSMNEMDTEEGAGLGFGFCILLGATAAAVCWSSRNRIAVRRFRPLAVVFILGSFISFLVFMVTSYVMSTARLLAPYYPLLMIPLLLIAHENIVRRRWWRVLAMSGFVLALLPLIASPPRPLFPWKPVVALLRRMGCPEKLVTRAETVYMVYGHRSDSFAPAIAQLPPEAVVLGLVTYDDPEAALWRPFGSRRVIHVCHDDSGAFLRTEGLSYVLVSSEKFQMDFQRPFERWLIEINGTLVQTVPLALRAGEGSVDWYLVKLN